MKNCLLLLVLFSLPLSLFGQVDETGSKSTLEKISSFNASEMKIIHTEELSVPDPNLPPPMNAQDSLAMESSQIKYNNNYVRFDKAQIAQLFPQAVTIDAENIIEVDYASFIPILMEAIKEQQLIIDELKSRISALESSVTK